MSDPNTLVRCDSIHAAQDSLAKHGYCLISLRKLFHGDYDELDDALTSLGEWCKGRDAYMDEHPESFYRSGRSHDPEEWDKRYSMNDWENWKCDAWLRVQLLLQPIFEELIGHGTEVRTLGGDTVRAHALTDQYIHSDGYTQRPNDADLCLVEWLVASVAVHDIERYQAPMWICSWETMMSWKDDVPPTEPADVDRLTQAGKYCTMHKGDLLLRDPRVWHKGTANKTRMIRFLPGLVLDVRRCVKGRA